MEPLMCSNTRTGFPRMQNSDNLLQSPSRLQCFRPSHSLVNVTSRCIAFVLSTFSTLERCQFLEKVIIECSFSNFHSICFLYRLEPFSNWNIWLCPCIFHLFRIESFRNDYRTSQQRRSGFFEASMPLCMSKKILILGKGCCFEQKHVRLGGKFACTIFDGCIV